MATLVILALLITAGGLAILQRTKASAITFIITIGGFLVIGCGLLPALLLKYLEFPPSLTEQPHWGKRNAIVTLGAGTVKLPQTNLVKPGVFSYSRIYETARLYLSCKKSGQKCVVIISGGDAFATGISEADTYQDALLNLGVNHSDTELETHSMNTYKNAELTSKLLNAEQFDQILLITSGIHLRRALLYFSRFAIHPVAAPADYIAAKISTTPLAYNFVITDYALHEYIGIARFHLYNFLGLNAKVTAPGSL